MALINENFLKLPESYLFSDIKKKVEAFKHLHPDANIISLGIGDVTRPIAPVVIEALHAAVDEMGDSKTFRGYGPEQGYDFLQKKIIENDYIHRGVDLAPDEIFISDGAKSDIGNIGDILSISAICLHSGIQQLEVHIRRLHILFSLPQMVYLLRIPYIRQIPCPRQYTK